MFVHGWSDVKRLISLAAEFDSGLSSVASIGGELTARVITGAEFPVELPSAAPGKVPGDRASLLNILIFRYPVTETAKKVKAAEGVQAKSNEAAVETEQLLTAGKRGPGPAPGQP